MFVSLKTKIIFHHVPKTAGTSIKSFLERNFVDYQTSHDKIFKINTQITDNTELHEIVSSWKTNYSWENKQNFPTVHISTNHAKKFIEFSKIDITNFFDFVVVRNPYTRIISQFLQIKPYQNTSFSIESLLNLYQHQFDKTRPLNYWYLKQAEWTNSLTGKVYIFKYEKLEKLWEMLFKQFNFYNQPIPYMNMQKGTYELSKKEKDLIYSMFKDEFEVYGYDR